MPKLPGAHEDFAVVKWTMAGTNTRPITSPDGATMPPTGRTITLPALTLYEVRDGKIAAERTYWDNTGLLAQLGLLPVPAS